MSRRPKTPWSDGPNCDTPGARARYASFLCECGCGQKLATIKVKGRTQAVFTNINGRRLRVECAAAIKRGSTK